jgi:hypothetical protein
MENKKLKNFQIMGIALLVGSGYLLFPDYNLPRLEEIKNPIGTYL